MFDKKVISFVSTDQANSGHPSNPRGSVTVKYPKGMDQHKEKVIQACQSCQRRHVSCSNGPNNSCQTYVRDCPQLNCLFLVRPCWRCIENGTGDQCRNAKAGQKHKGGRKSAKTKLTGVHKPWRVCLCYLILFLAQCFHSPSHILVIAKQAIIGVSARELGTTSETQKVSLRGVTASTSQSQEFVSWTSKIDKGPHSKRHIDHEYIRFVQFE